MQLTDFIKQQRQAGVSDTDIKAALSQQGWPPQDIDEALAPTANPSQVNYAAPTSTPVNPTTQASPTTQQPKPKAPLFVIIIAWLMLIIGIIILLSVLPLLFLGGVGVGVFFVLGLINLVQGIGLVAVSFGIRHMRRWALYVFTAVTLLSVATSLCSLLTAEKQEPIGYLFVSLQVLTLIYFWSVHKRFV